MMSNLVDFFIREAEDCSYIHSIGSGGYGEVHKVLIHFVLFSD